MLKKTALVIGTSLLTSSCAWAQMLIHLNLTVDGKSTQQQSIVVENNKEAACQLDDLLFEITPRKQDQSVTLSVKIFRVTNSEKMLVATPEFTVELGAPAHLQLEKDGHDLDLTFVTVDIV